MIEIVRPWPDMVLSPNARPNRHAKAEAVRNAKQAAALATRAALASANSHGIDVTAKRIPLTLYFYPPDRRWRDLDNLHGCEKASIDSIAEVLGINDRVFAPHIQDWGEVVKGGQVVVLVGEP